MKTAILSISLCLCAATAITIQMPAQARDPDPASVKTDSPAPQALPGVTVQGDHDPLSKSDRHLQQLRRSLPELASGTPRKKKLTDKAREYLAHHANPEMAAGQQRKMMERARQPQGMPEPGSEH